MGGLKNVPVDDAVGGAIAKQEKEREGAAYEKGKSRSENYKADPTSGGGSKDDGYGGMSPSEKEAYKKGHRGSRVPETENGGGYMPPQSPIVTLVSS